MMPQMGFVILCLQVNKVDNDNLIVNKHAMSKYYRIRNIETQKRDHAFRMSKITAKSDKLRQYLPHPFHFQTHPFSQSYRDSGEKSENFVT